MVKINHRRIRVRSLSQCVRFSAAPLVLPLIFLLAVCSIAGASVVRAVDIVVEAPAAELDLSNTVDLAHAYALERRIRSIQQDARACTVVLQRRSRRGRIIGTGCAVLIEGGRYAVTAAHVLDEPGDRMSIELADGRTFDAITMGLDDDRDFGLLRIVDGEDLPAAELGQSGELVRDEVCLMFGHPGGVERGRPSVLRIGTFLGVRSDGMLRTDCLMMPGDSGGPLFDLDGRLIAINSQISSDLDENFHVPVDPVRASWDRLVASEVIERDSSGGEGRRRGRSSRAPVGDKPTVLAGGRDRLAEQIETAHAPLARHVVMLRSETNGERFRSAGTIVTTDGLVVSKSSGVGDDAITCELPDRRVVVARVIGRDTDNDIALLRIDAFDLELEPVSFHAAPEPAAGRLAWTMTPGGSVPWVGVLGAPERRIPRDGWGFMGVQFERSRGSGSLGIRRATEGGPSEYAGIRSGDRVVAFDGIEVETGSALRQLLRQTIAGEQVVIAVQREDETLEYLVRLGNSRDAEQYTGASRRSRGHIADRAEVSERRAGFESAFRHDMPIDGDACGAPVFDLDGQLIGLNIARADRTGSLALPADLVEATIVGLLEEEAAAMEEAAADSLAPGAE